ncbi:MAG TPA: hypothetical protein VFX52_04810 [Nocardioidaceae bacterium]|nr:hypothetical protein [Nocardioidaceae bacterium]
MAEAVRRQVDPVRRETSRRRPNAGVLGSAAAGIPVLCRDAPRPAGSSTLPTSVDETSPTELTGYMVSSYRQVQEGRASDQSR